MTMIMHAQTAYHHVFCLFKAYLGSFQLHTPQSPLPTYHPYSITHTTQHTVTTTHSPSQLHLLYTQNSLNTHHKLLIHIPQLFPYSASSINATAWPHSTPQTITSTSLHYKHLHHSCWYLKGTVYKAIYGFL